MDRHPKIHATRDTLLDGESVEMRERFLGNVPLPLRTVFKVFGERVYAGYRAQIYGSA